MLGALACVGTGAYAAVGEGEHSPANPSADIRSLESGTTAVAAVDDDIAAYFAIFRDRAPDTMPADTRSKWVVQRFGRNPTLARRIHCPGGAVETLRRG